MTNHKNLSTRCGSVYVTTLVTVAAVSTTVLVGVKLRSSTNDRSAIIEQMTQSNQSLDNLTEYALQVIADDGNWNTTAQSGVVVPKFIVDGVTYAGTVVDADDNKTPTEDTTDYKLTLSATKDIVTNSAQISLVHKSVDYAALIDDYFAWNYWPLNETARTATATDVIDGVDGSYNDPDIAGTAQNDEGALVPLFAGSNDHVDVPYSKFFESNSGAFSLWMNSTGTVNLKSYGVLGMQYTSGGSPNLSLIVVNNALGAYIAESGSFNITKAAITSSVLTPDTWHHVAVTFGSEGLFIYVDGVQAAVSYSNTSGLDTAKAKDGGEQPLYIGGGYTIGWSSQPFVGFEGSIAHVVFYKNHQLTADEVATIAAVKPDESRFALIADSWTTVYND